LWDNLKQWVDYLMEIRSGYSVSLGQGRRITFRLSLSEREEGQYIVLGLPFLMLAENGQGHFFRTSVHAADRGGAVTIIVFDTYRLPLQV
jgi:hypothetical protein